MAMTVEPAQDEVMIAAGDPDAEFEHDEPQSLLFPSLDAYGTLLTPLWRDAELLG